MNNPFTPLSSTMHRVAWCVHRQEALGLRCVLYPFVYFLNMRLVLEERDLLLGVGEYSS